jgi:transposase
MQLRDALGTIDSHEPVAALFPVRGQPAEAPWRLALVTVFPFMEHVPDRQAADAVRRRLDWTSALSLELTDPGVDHPVRSELRSRLVRHGAQERLLDTMVELLQLHGWREGTRSSADGCYACAGHSASAQPGRTGRGDRAGRSQRPGHCRT